MGKLCGFHPAPFAEVARSSGSCGQPPQGHPYVTPTPAAKPGLPSPAGKPPMAGNSIKHDGFRVIARKDGERIKLYSRPGNDLTGRFPLIVEALALRSRSCIIDGEAVACDDNGMERASTIRYRRYDAGVFL